MIGLPSDRALADDDECLRFFSFIQTYTTFIITFMHHCELITFLVSLSRISTMSSICWTKVEKFIKDSFSNQATAKI